MDARLQAELAETKMELQRLRESISPGTPTLQKDISLVTLIPKWSGSDSSVTLEEFLSSVESAARIGKWVDADKREISVLKLEGSAKMFYQGCTELHEEGATWQDFKNAFRRRYEDVHTDQFHFTRLQNARQGKRESIQEFADRCKSLAQKIVCKSDDPLAQRVHHEVTERMLLSSFFSGIFGKPGTQVRYACPQTLNEALRIALRVQEAEKQERFNETFYTKFDESVRLLSRSPDRENPGSWSQRRTADNPDTKHSRGQRYNTQKNTGRAETLNTRNAQTRSALRCYECQGMGHFARDCANRTKRNSNSSGSPGKRDPPELSKHPRSPGENFPQGNERKANSSGNANEARK